MERGRDDPGQPRPRHCDAVARRRRCGGAARVRPFCSRFRIRRFHAAGGQGRGRLARSRHAVAVLGAGRGHGHQLGLCAHRAAVAARSRPAGRPGHLRDERRPYGGLGGCRSRDRGRSCWYLSRGSAFSTQSLWIGDRTGPKTRIDLPTDAWVTWHRGWLAVRRRTAWTIGDDTYAPDTVLGISFAAFLAGDRRFTKLFEPAERRALQGFFWCGGRLHLSILDDLKPVFEALTPSETGWSRERITGLPDIGRGQCLAARCPDGRVERRPARQRAGPADAAVAVPGASRRCTRAAEAGAAMLSIRPALSLRATKRSSPDGTRIPYVQVGPPGETGDAPVHLSGYGGFRISQLPYYNPAVGKLWLERGGTERCRQYQGRRRVRHRLARGRTTGGQACSRTTISPRSPPTSCGAG